MFITFVWIVDCRLHVFTVLISHADESVLIFLPFCEDDFELTNLIIQLDWLQEMVSLAKTCCDCTSFWSSSFLALGKSYPFFLLNYYNLENYPGVKINGENINNIRYADETVLIADSEENLQRLLQGWATSGFFRNSGFFFFTSVEKKQPEPGKLTIFFVWEKLAA